MLLIRKIYKATVAKSKFLSKVSKSLVTRFPILYQLYRSDEVPSVAMGDNLDLYTNLMQTINNDSSLELAVAKLKNTHKNLVTGTDEHSKVIRRQLAEVAINAEQHPNAAAFFLLYAEYLVIKLSELSGKSQNNNDLSPFLYTMQ